MRRIEGPADGADFAARVPVQFQAVAAAAAGAASGCAVALPLAIIDRAVVEGVTNAAGKVRRAWPRPLGSAARGAGVARGSAACPR